SIFPKPVSTGDVQMHAVVSAATVFQAAIQQGIRIVALTAANATVLDGLAISSVAKARITRALQAGKLGLVPYRAVNVGRTPAIAWYETDQQTGETTGVGEDGNHSAVFEVVTVIAAGLLVGTAVLTLQGIAAIAKVQATLAFDLSLPLWVTQVIDNQLPPGPDAVNFKKKYLALQWLDITVASLKDQVRIKSGLPVWNAIYIPAYDAQLDFLAKQYG